MTLREVGFSGWTADRATDRPLACPVSIKLISYSSHVAFYLPSLSPYFSLITVRHTQGSVSASRLFRRIEVSNQQTRNVDRECDCLCGN